MRSLKTSANDWRYKALIGTGGIGSGAFFALKDNHTLGREESRAGRFLDRRDYCKLHIIEHYAQNLLGAGFPVIPVGKVGDDGPGRQMLAEMKEAGLTTEYVEVAAGEQTLYSICLVYPDGAGGNLTVENSASAKVDAACIGRVEPEFARHVGTGMTLAAPEVPMVSRAELLRLGRRHRFFNTASFTSGELRRVRTGGQIAADTGLVEMLRMVDFLAINRDEAAMLAGCSAAEPAESIAGAAVEALRSVQDDIQCSITAGHEGSWVWDGQTLSFAPAPAADVISTAGAGDAFYGGMLVGTALGLSAPESQQLATLIAAMKVTCPHTIDKSIDRDSLREFASRVNAPLSDRVRRLLEAGS